MDSFFFEIPFLVAWDLSRLERAKYSMFYPRSYYLAIETVRSVCVEEREELAPIADRLIEFTLGLFHGENPAFEPCDTAFHDFDHTMESAEAVLRLLAAQDRVMPENRLSNRQWEIALASILLHDAGYLKKRDDPEGSGAKYTSIHVGRSCFLAWDLLPALGFEKDEIRLVQQAICATAIGAKMKQIGFRSRSEWLIGALVATGDLLGQMGANDYPERLPALYLELREAALFSRLEEGSLTVYQSLLELLAGTEKFYSDYVIKTLDREWGSVHRWLDTEDGSNPYLQRIHRNVDRATAMSRTLRGLTLPLSGPSRLS
ncbi:MAG TPA: hypothetical protein VE242_05520 [Chthoniobacterales bacterium]|nr:hypothetical protein [Chthoniobacterales bacterium]